MLDGKFVSSQKVFNKVVVKGLDLGEEKVEHHLKILVRSVSFLLLFSPTEDVLD